MRFCTLLVLLPLLMLTARAEASTPVSVGYYKVMDFGTGSLSNDEPIAQAIDVKGNVYIASYHPFGQYDGWVIQKLDPAGLPIWRRDLSIGGPPLGMAVDASGNVALLGYTWTGFNTDTDMVVAKLDASGNPLWIRRFDGGANLQDFPQDIYLAPDGSVKAAVTASDSSGRYLAIVGYDKDGNDGASFADHTLSSVGGHFTPDGHFLLSGSDNTGVNMWEYLDPNFQTVVKESFAPTATARQYYTVAADPLGYLHVITSIIDNSTMPAGQSYSTRTLSSTGALINFALVSNAQNLYVAPVDSINTYTVGFEAGNYVLKKFDSNGVVWTVTPNTTIYSVAVDGTNGVVVVTRNKASDPFMLQKYTPNGTMDWSVNLTPSATLSNLLNIQAPVIAGGAIHCLLKGTRAGSGDDVIAASYVEGRALKSLTSAAQVKGGTSFFGSISLNLADANKKTVKLGSNSNSLIWTPSTVTVPANLATAGFLAYTAVVDAPSPVTIYAEDGSVLRSAVVTILPAALSNCNLAMASLKGGLNTTLTVTLDGPTGLLGRAVTLKSSDTSVANVPSSVFIAPGNNSVSVTVKTTASKAGNVTLSATAQGVTKTTLLTVTP